MRSKKSLRDHLRWGALLLILALLLLLPAASIIAEEPLLPPDPTADIPWSGPETFANIAAAFNNARATESTQLSIVPPLPNLVMPFTEAEWNAMSDDDRALWLINQERAVRGVYPMEGVEANVAGVAQTYADYLVANNVWGHNENGSPTDRMTGNPAIGACYDSAWIENLSLFAGSGPRAIPIALSIYMWMYEDIGSAWGHRHAILHDTFNSNACLAGTEGYLGIGHAGAAGYDPLSWGFPYGETVVMNAFDPCSTWSPCGPTAIDLACFEAAPAEGVGTLVVLLCCGMLAGSGVVVSNRRRK